MSQIPSNLISDIRSASRDLVRQFGLMNQGVAGTDLSLSAVHAIIEIGRARSLMSRDLCDRLLLEKSTVSRLVKSLVARGEIVEVRSKDDLRVKHLQLTRQGRMRLHAIESYAERQVSGALQRLDGPSRRGVLQGLRDYSAALKTSSSENDEIDSSSRFDLGSGYRPTIIGRVVTMMHAYMNEYFDFGLDFETRIAGDLAEFMARIDSPRNQTWWVDYGGRISGSISIDGEDLDDGLAHLRWFVVDDELRGSGAGRVLLERALDFCDHSGYRENHLWTVQGLDAARRLYEAHGFELVEQYYGDQWGAEILEQKFVRIARA